MLARGRNYQDIARKNIFAPPAAKVVTVDPPKKEIPTEDPNDVYPFVKLTQPNRSAFRPLT